MAGKLKNEDIPDYFVNHCIMCIGKCEPGWIKTYVDKVETYKLVDSYACYEYNFYKNLKSHKEYLIFGILIFLLLLKMTFSKIKNITHEIGADK